MNAHGGSDLSLDDLVRLQEAASDPPPGPDRPGGGDGPEPEGGGVVVLPWWQHPVNIVTMIVTAAILAAMVGWMVGDSGAEIEYNDVDRGFLQDMRVHHEQAVQMSFVFLLRPDTDPGLRTIARSIVQGQSLEIGRMIQLLRSFGEDEVNPDSASMLWMGMSATPGQMPGIASDDELVELGGADGAEADELYVALMTEHHLGGIEMAEFAVDNAENDEVIAFAAGMIDGQRGEIVEMAGQIDDG